MIVEKGIQTLGEYWNKDVEPFYKYQQFFIHEFVILKVLRQIAAALQEVHDRGDFVNKKNN
jgi:hypothetical protein